MNSAIAPSPLKVLLFTAISVSLSGCGNLNTAFRTHETPNMKLVSIDAKQRVITTSRGSEADRSEVTCAEPSPDALSAASASGSGSYELAAKAVGLGYSAAEGAAYIGLRTQTIQILRDAMYRLCEGYAAGALTKDRYHRLQRHYQSSMIALLAIEQLTGAVVARPASINTAGGVERGKLLQQAKEAVDAASAAVDSATKAKTNADKESTAAADAAKDAQTEIDKIDKDATKSADQKTAAKKPFQDLLDAKAAKAKAASAAAEKVTNATADLDAAKTFQSDARNALSLTSSAAASVQVINMTSQVNKDTADAIGKNIYAIVDRALSISFREEMCTGMMVDALDHIQSKKSDTAEALARANRLLEVAAILCTQTSDDAPQTSTNAPASGTASRPPVVDKGKKPSSVVDRLLLVPQLR